MILIVFEGMELNAFQLALINLLELMLNPETELFILRLTIYDDV